MTKTTPEGWQAWIAAKDWPTCAAAGRQDFYAFCVYILGYDKLQEDIHRKWCRRATDFNQLRRLYLEPRETYKSTVYTIGLSLWMLVQTEPVVRGITGNNLRILIANAVASKALDFAREIDGHLRRNPFFKVCYGDLHNRGQWTGSQKTIASRTLNRKEPSLQTIGKGGQLTSAHYDVAIIDDIVNERDRDSYTERERTQRWVRDLLSLVHPDGLVEFLGTRWAYEDVYYHIMYELNTELIVGGQRPYEVVSEGCYLEDGITPRFPTILDADKLERLKIEKGSFEFASQYRNEPMPPEAQIFRERELQYFDLEEVPGECDVIGYCDPALGKTETACFSAIMTVYRARDTGVCYLMDADLARRPTEQLETDVLHLFQAHRYTKFGFECNGFQDETRKNCERRLAKEYQPFAMRSVIHGGDKVQRIQAAEPVIKACRFRRDWRAVYPELMRQLTQFPNGNFVDGPDALEGVLTLDRQRPGEDRKIAESNQAARSKKGIGSSIMRQEW